MNNYKYLVELVVPSIDAKYDIYFPVNRRIGNIIELLNKALFDETNGAYVGSSKTMLYDSSTGDIYNVNLLVRDTNIKNGSIVVLL